MIKTCRHQWAPLLAKAGGGPTPTLLRVCLKCGDLKVGTQTIRISRFRIDMGANPIKNLGLGTATTDAARRDEMKATLKRLSATNQAFAAATVTNKSLANAYQYGIIRKVKVEKTGGAQETGYVYFRFYSDSAYVNEISPEYSFDLSTADQASQYVAVLTLGDGIPYALDATTLYFKVKCQNAISLDYEVTIEQSTE